MAACLRFDELELGIKRVLNGEMTSRVARRLT